MKKIIYENVEYYFVKDEKGHPVTTRVDNGEPAANRKAVCYYFIKAYGDLSRYKRPFHTNTYTLEKYAYKLLEEMDENPQPVGRPKRPPLDPKEVEEFIIQLLRENGPMTRMKMHRPLRDRFNRLIDCSNLLHRMEDEGKVVHMYDESDRLYKYKLIE